MIKDDYLSLFISGISPALAVYLLPMEKSHAKTRKGYALFFHKGHNLSASCRYLSEFRGFRSYRLLDVFISDVTDAGFFFLGSSKGKQRAMSEKTQKLNWVICESRSIKSEQQERNGIRYSTEPCAAHWQRFSPINWRVNTKDTMLSKHQ